MLSARLLSRLFKKGFRALRLAALNWRQCTLVMCRSCSKLKLRLSSLLQARPVLVWQPNNRDKLSLLMHHLWGKYLSSPLLPSRPPQSQPPSRLNLQPQSRTSNKLALRLKSKLRQSTRLKWPRSKKKRNFFRWKYKSLIVRLLASRQPNHRRYLDTWWGHLIEPVKSLTQCNRDARARSPSKNE